MKAAKLIVLAVAIVAFAVIALDLRATKAELRSERESNDENTLWIVKTTQAASLKYRAEIAALEAKTNLVRVVTNH